MISSPGNETLKAIRRLRRERGDHALLEGPHLVREALDEKIPLETVLVTPRFVESAAGRELERRLPAPPRRVAEELLDRLADADAPRGIVAVARLQRPRLADRRLSDDEAWLYLDGIQDPGNLGAIARVAEGLGANGLLLSPGCADPNHPRALRASAGSLLRLPAVRGVEAADGAAWSAGAPWIGLEAHAGAEPLRALRGNRPFVLALGAEGPGLSAAVRERLDRTVTIPLHGRLESLNVAVAAALVLDRLLPEVVEDRVTPR